MDDKKLEMFFSKELWNETIEKAVDKRLDKSLLGKLCDIETRIALADAISERRYRIAPPRVGLIPKDDGSFRKVYINTDLDRVVLSLINDVYFKMYGHTMSPYCVSYQKGLGVSKIIDQIVDELHDVTVTKEVLGYKVDISKYFDSVNKETLFETLDMLDTGSAIDHIVRQYYSEDLIIDEDMKLVTHYKSLAQGCAVSSFLANYALRDIDFYITTNFDVLYYRYSDDILIIGDDAKEALGVLEDMLKIKGLSLHPKKVEAIYPDTWFTFLGFKINGYKVTFSDKSMTRFKSEIKQRTKTTKETKLKSFDTVRRTIKDVNRYMYTGFMESDRNFGWAEYMFATVNQIEDIQYLDNFVKDHIRHMYTGKWNSYSNYNKVPNEKLKELGYLSMVHLYKLRQIHPDLYRAEVRRVLM